MSDKEYAVVGGGIAGASIASHLARRGADDVVLYERGEVASETTAKSFALFGSYGGDTLFDLKRYGMRLYNELARENSAVKYDRIGHLSVATTEEAREELKRAVENQTGDAGIFATGADRTGVQFLEGNEIKERLFFPEADTSDVTAGVYRPEVGYFEPAVLTETILQRARDRGVIVKKHAHVDDIHVDCGAVTGLTVDGERVDAENVVIAAGPWTPALAAKAGIDIPVRHSLAPALVVEPDTTTQTLPSLKHHESNFNFRGNAADGTVYVGNHAGGYGHGKQLDPDDVPSSVPDDIRKGATDALERFLPLLRDAPVVDEWVGVRSLTPDGRPIVGWTAVEGLSVVAFNTSGVQLSPAVGHVVATQLVEGEPTKYYDSLSITRFDDHQDIS